MSELEQVITITEAALLWQKSKLTVRRALDARRKPLVGRKSPDNIGGVWLITRSSLIARWGKPIP